MSHHPRQDLYARVVLDLSEHLADDPPRRDRRGRLKVACQHRYDTADGTFLTYGPDENLPRLLRYIRTAENHAATEPML